MQVVDGAVLGQLQLATVDTAGGERQHFTSPDGSVLVVLDGMVQNHEELRRLYHLSTTSRCDGSILPELWERLGTSMFATVRGSYAIVVYDRRARTITLARDPLGIRPLHWARTVDGTVAFASAVKPLISVLPVRRLNMVALAHYLTTGTTLSDQSPIEGVESVPANGWVQWSLKGNAIVGPVDGVVYPGLLAGPLQSVSHDLRAEFLEVVAECLAGNARVAVPLRLDFGSASVAWACAVLGRQTTCVTVDAGFEVSETASVAQIAGRYGHRHEVVSVEPDESLVTKYFSSMQKPTMGGMNTFLVNRAIAALDAEVAVSGRAADQLFAEHIGPRLLRRLRLRRGDIWGTGTTGQLAGDRDGRRGGIASGSHLREIVGRATLLRSILADEQVSGLASGLPDATPVSSVGADRSLLTLAARLISLGASPLPNLDSFSMTWSVEPRMPYTDIRLVHSAITRHRQRGLSMRQFAEQLGDPRLIEIARRVKGGSSLPIDRWMRRGTLAPWVRAVSSSSAPVRRLLRVDAIDSALTEWHRGRLDWRRVWLIASLNGWLSTLHPEFVDVSPTGPRHWVDTDRNATVASPQN